MRQQLPSARADCASGVSAVPRRTTVREMPIAALPDSVVGYQELGLGDVQDGPALLDQGSGRINSLRTFWPSHLYDPEVNLTE